VVLLDDIIISVAAGVTVLSLVVLAAFLARYRSLVEEANKSTEMAKNVYDSMNSRFTTQDTRIVDLMARLDVYSVRHKPLVPGSSVTGQADVTRQASRVHGPTTQESQARSQISGSPGGSLAPSSSSPSPSMAAPSSALQQPQPQQQLPPPPSPTVASQTDAAILRALMDGPRTSNTIKDVLKVSREHNARLLKSLYDRGLVVRNDEHKPYVYEITEAGRRFLGGGSSGPAPMGGGAPSSP
jgi:DNA-binding transcriptional ArsR family regulator